MGKPAIVTKLNQAAEQAESLASASLKRVQANMSKAGELRKLAKAIEGRSHPRAGGR